MENEANEENVRSNEDGSVENEEETQFLDLAFGYLISLGSKRTPQAIAGVGLAILALADQLRQYNLIWSAEVFGFTEGDTPVEHEDILEQQ